MKTVSRMEDAIERILITDEEIREKIRQIGAQITLRLSGKKADDGGNFKRFRRFYGGLDARY